VHYLNKTYSEDIFTNLYAVSLRLTFFPDNKGNTMLYFETNNGILTYWNKMRQVVASPYLITSKTLGSFDKIGFGFKLSNPLWLDINAGLTGGLVRKFELTSRTSSRTIIFDNNQRESLIKIFVTIGLSYKF
jgi:hypothetical protein